MLKKATHLLTNRNLPIPKYEEKRLLALRSYHILDTKKENEFDRLTELASLICDVPIAFITLIDDNRLWFKSTFGFDIHETNREMSFCQYAITGNSIFEVEDASIDDRFKSNPLVTGAPGFHFYAGCPLIDSDGYALGSLCVVDYKPNKLSHTQHHALTTLGKEVISHIESKKEKNENLNYKQLFKHSIDLVCLAGTDGFFKKVNPAFSRVLGWTEKELLEKPFNSFVHPDDVQKTLAEIARLSHGEKTINFVNRYLAKSGEYKTLDWVSNPDPITGSIYAIARDITEKIKTQVQLSIAEKKFRVLFEDSPDAVFVEDGCGVILDVNQAAVELQEMPKEKLIGENIRNLVPRDKYVHILRCYKQLYFGAVKTVESSIWTPSGREVPVEISGKSVSYNNTSALLLHVRDVSERKKLEAERVEITLERSRRKERMIQVALNIQEDERKRIAAEMHDEIGAGLSKISILGQVIKKSNQNSSIVACNIEKILQASKEIQKNINEIVWAMDPKYDTLENLLAYINDYASEFLEASVIGFHIQLSRNIPSVVINGKVRRTIFLIIKELLNNVVKHSESTQVEMEVGFEDKGITLIIHDNGKGFDTVSIPRFKNGISNMRRRIAEVGGQFNITSKPGEGVIIELIIPDKQSERSRSNLLSLK